MSCGRCVCAEPAPAPRPASRAAWHRGPCGGHHPDSRSERGSLSAGGRPAPCPARGPWDCWAAGHWRTFLLSRSPSLFISSLSPLSHALRPRSMCLLHLPREKPAASGFLSCWMSPAAAPPGPRPVLCIPRLSTGASALGSRPHPLYTRVNILGGNQTLHTAGFSQ